jgi:ubiquitin carboxyl-terminal hydrolase 4/11/15
MGTWSNQGTLHNSIEADGDDEGIGLTPHYDTPGMAGMTSVLGSANWSFDNLGSNNNAGSGSDIASDVAQGDGSSANGDVFDDQPGELETLLHRQEEDDELPYVEHVEDQVIDFANDLNGNNDSPPPSAENQDYISRLAAQSWVQKQVQQGQPQVVHTVPPAVVGEAGDEDDGASDKVAEIHVGGDAADAADADVEGLTTTTTTAGKSHA